MRALLLTAFAFVMAVTPASAAERVAEKVIVRGGLHADYGRIVFDWPSEVGYEAAIEEGRLAVSFDQAADFQGDLLQGGLRGYAGAARVAEDGQGLSLPLEGDFALQHFRLGNRVVLDLRQAAARATAEDTGAEDKGPEDKGPEAVTVRVRGGQHDGFSRLVFDWRAPVGNVLEEAPGRARIIFDRSAEFDVAPARAQRLAQISKISTDGLGVSFSVPEGSRLQVTRSGTKVVLDVHAPDPAPAAANTAEAPPPKESEAPAAEKRAATDTAKAAAKVVDLTPRPAAPAESGEQPVASESAAAAPEVEEDERADTAAPTSIVPKSMGGEAALPEIKAPATPPATPVADPEKAKSPSPKAPDTAQDSADFTGSDAAVEPKAVADGDRGTFDVRSEPMPSFITSQAQGPKADAFDPVVLTFEWNRPAAAAAFRRGENLWLVFDRPAPMNVISQIATVAPHLGEAQLLEHDGSTILVIRAVPTVAPRLSRDGQKWTVDLRPRSPLPERGLAAPVIETSGGKRVRFPMIGAGRMLWVTDPDAGDRLVVVPTRGAGMGLALPYSYPQFHSLPTQQGVVLQPLTPGIEVATIRSGVLVRGRHGLLVSDADERRAARRIEDTAVERPGLLDLAKWRRGGIETFQENRQALMAAMEGLEGARLGVARLDLARLFFANGFGSETLGSVRVIEDENPRLAKDPQVRLMKGASQVMMQDFHGAATSLAHPALVGERQALLWQAALAAQAEDWQAAATGFAATRDLIGAYPRNLRLDLNLAAAESFLQAGNLEAAAIHLGHLLRENLDEREMQRAKVVQGALSLAKGDPEEARELWSEVRAGTHPPSRARARLALIDLGLAEGTLSPDAAIAELERLRFAWRGDYFELTLMRKLAELYAQQDRHRDALYALREAASNFPDGPAARNAAQRMREIFTGIYRGAGDPDVPPLRALALYQEFMELTPGGPEGDRIIAALADRLVEVDLLDRAAELLEGQVRYRLEGAEKARIGARLALVHLLNHQPEASLTALDVSEVEDAGEDVALQRRQLRARALSGLGRSEDALELLEGDDSLDAAHLRADIHWHQRQWPKAVDSLSKLIPLLPPRRSMKEEESQLVVNLAVALLLSQQPVALEDLNRRYGAAMAKGPHADTFELLVADGGMQTVGSIAEELSRVAEAQDFMAGYRERLRDGELSQTN